MKESYGNSNSQYNSSAMDNGIVAKRSADQIKGQALNAIVNRVLDSFYVNESYIHVKAFDLPKFDSRFTYYLVNFYYEQEKDPKTYLDCYRVFEDHVEHT
jgi:hypothetical protein